MLLRPDGGAVCARGDGRLLDGGGRRLTRAAGLALVVLGIWVGLSPSSLPGLTEPDQAPAMQMEMHA
jgi:hypothetical protein